MCNYLRNLSAQLYSRDFHQPHRVYLRFIKDAVGSSDYIGKAVI